MVANFPAQGILISLLVTVPIKILPEIQAFTGLVIKKPIKILPEIQAFTGLVIKKSLYTFYPLK